MTLTAKGGPRTADVVVVVALGSPAVDRWTLRAEVDELLAKIPTAPPAARTTAATMTRRRPLRLRKRNADSLIEPLRVEECTPVT